VSDTERNRDAEPPDAAPPTLPTRAEVVVLGAGAAGLWAAATAAGRGRSVLLLEKNRRVGVKILASGGGHCNLTTTLAVPALLPAFGPEGARFLAPSVRRLPPLRLREVFAALGVPTREAELEKVWPVSNRARDVLDALVRRAVAAGVAIRTATPCLDLVRTGDGFLVRTPAGDVACARVIVTVGGASYPRTGTTGDGYPWLAALGHTIVPPVPALAPLVIDVPWVRALAGIAEAQALVRVTAGGKTIAKRRRPVLFTHTGLSGPGPMDVSRWFERPPPTGAPSLHVDFLPDLSEATLRANLDAAIAKAPGDRLARVAPVALPARLLAALAAAANVDLGRRAGETPHTARHALVRGWKDVVLPVAGTRGFDFAEVTAGGVALPEVDPGTMASRIVPGLYVAGEILDVDGPIGGFNFQAAFSTGESAGLFV
jgi:hypothetical protein